MKYAELLKADLLGEDLGRARREFACGKFPREIYDRSGSPEPHPDGGPWVCESADARHEVGYQTGSGNQMIFLNHIFEMDREDIPLLTDYEHVSLCKDCRGSSGGCPGFAPRFESLKKNVDKFFVATISIDMIWSIMYATPKDGWLGRRVLKQLVYTDRLTENYGKRMVRFIKENKLGYPLGLGNCMGCYPKHCTVIRGETCTKPKKRTFSMEAVGIDCDTLHEMLFDECLPWYYKGTNKIPSYMTRYIGFFPNRDDPILYTYLCNFMQKDKSYIPATDAPEPREASVMLQQIPHGQHEGDFQYVYNDPGLVQV